MPPHERGVPSTAAVAGHPIHPMLIPFPMAFLVGAFATDLAYWGTASPFWAQVGVWLVGAGLVTGVLAAAVGFVDFLTIERARDHNAGWIHLIGNVLVLVLTFVTLLLRVADVEGAVLPWGLLLTFLITVGLVVTGWYGGELSYRHKIGVIESHEASGSPHSEPNRGGGNP